MTLKTEISKKKVLIFVHSFEMGGIQVNILNTVKNLYGTFDFYLVVFKKTNSTVEKDIKKYLKGSFVLNEKIFTLETNESAILKISNIITKTKPDVIETHMFFIDIPVRESTKRLLYKNVIVYQHGFGKGWSKKENNLERKYIDSTKKYLCVTKWNKNILKKVGIPSKKIDVIYNGIDTKIITKSQRNKNSKFIIGFIGRLEYSKNPLILPDIAEELIKIYKIENFIIYIVGAGSMLAELKQKIKNKKLSKFFIFNKEVPHDEIMKIYNKVDLLLIPSNNESLPTTAIEASFVGLPVVASHIAGIPELIKNNKTGFLIKKNKDYSKVISKLVKNDKLYKRIIKNITINNKIYKKIFSQNSYISNRKKIWEQNMKN